MKWESNLKQATQNKPYRRPLAVQMGHRIREGLVIIAAATGLFLLVSFATYHNTDPGWLGTGVKNHIANWGGRVGAFLADVLLSLFGYVAYLFPPLIVFGCWAALQTHYDLNQKKTDGLIKWLGFVLIIVCACGLANFLLPVRGYHLPTTSGGIAGDVIGSSLLHTFNPMGGLLFLVALMLCGITLFTGFSWLGLIDFMRISALANWNKIHVKKSPLEQLPLRAVTPKEEKTF